MRCGDTYKLVEVRGTQTWTFWTQSHDVSRLKAKWPAAKIFNQYGEEV